MTTLTFNNTTLTTITQNNQIWLTSSELAKALDYKNSKSVSNLYNANADEFTDNMTRVIESVTRAKHKGFSIQTRIFSLRGCHLIAMFSRTKVAKEFRKWVLDILDNEVGNPKLVTELTPEQTLPLRNAVNSLVTKAGIMYPEAYKMIHQRFNVNHIKQLQSEQVAEAVEYVHGLTLVCSKNKSDADYHAKMINMGIKKTSDIDHAVSVAEKYLYKLEQSIDSLATSIEVIKTHNSTNFSVFKSLE